MEAAYWGRKTFCLITGASRGIGRCIALEFSKKVGPNSVILLFARSLPGLEATRADMLKLRGDSDIRVTVAAVDLGKPDSTQYKTLIQSSMENSNPSSFEHVIIVQNAASLGIKSGLSVAEMDHLEDIQDYYSLNLNSFIILNAAFFKIFPAQTTEKNQTRSVVHISSDGALEPFKTWGLYCAAKAARDMLLKSMAIESGIHALNWAPGCVNTDIYEEAVMYTADPELARFFEESRKAGKVLSCEQTVTKLMRVLAGQQFIKGEHVGYHDIPDV